MSKHEKKQVFKKCTKNFGNIVEKTSSLKCPLKREQKKTGRSR